MNNVEALYNVYLVKGFIKREFREFLPDPCIFLTQTEALEFCIQHSAPNIFYEYFPVRVGKYDIKTRQDKED